LLCTARASLGKAKTLFDCLWQGREIDRFLNLLRFKGLNVRSILMGTPNTTVEKMIARMIGSGQFNGISLSGYREADASQFHFSGGALDFRSPYFATGTSKLYVTAILMQLRAEGKIALDTPFLSYFEGERLYNELHVRHGVDYTDQITIRHLMSHTSGLSESFLYEKRGRNLKHGLITGKDSSWTFEDMIARTRSLTALARPGSARKATFAAVNFQILEHIIERIEGKSFAEVFKARLVEPLGLTATYLYSDPSDERPLNLMSRCGELKIPRTIGSFGASCGVVTTSREALIFVRAFFEGYLFNRSAIKDLYAWRPFFPSSDYGVGIARLNVSRAAILPMRLREPLCTLRPVPTLYGHIGMGCSVLFYAPEAGIYISGTTNNITKSMTCFRLVHRVIEAIHLGEVDAQLKTSELGASRFASRHRITNKDDIKDPDWAARRPFRSIDQV
jgi:CubicO group peptidase (beta-lactamase class C family)